VSEDAELCRRARYLATRPAIRAALQHSQVGYNYRMSNLLAAIAVDNSRFDDR